MTLLIFFLTIFNLMLEIIPPLILDYFYKNNNSKETNIIFWLSFSIINLWWIYINYIIIKLKNIEQYKIEIFLITFILSINWSTLIVLYIIDGSKKMKFKIFYLYINIIPKFIILSIFTHHIHKYIYKIKSKKLEYPSV